jgi:uncharacterized MAPEG superfamily protein
MLPILVKTWAYGLKWNVGARDDTQPEPSPATRRLERAQANFFETFPLAIVALIGVVVANRTSPETAWHGWMWLGARALYLPVYWMGIPVLRTIIFGVAVAGIIDILKVLLVG